MKRGKKQRVENVNDKILYRPLFQDDVEENKAKYNKILVGLGLDRDSEARNMSEVKRTIEQNTISEKMDFARAKTYRVYDL